ncbi:MAG: [protein-PII] uridylyltransferase [Planctomyces sp.]|nr:[protein-PII] uridylyltransferase [Planctomyces sp.]
MTAGRLESVGLRNGALAEKKARVHRMRDRARSLFERGAGGVAVAACLSEQTDALVVDLFAELLAEQPERIREGLARETAIVAVGGTGRGELAPYSDVDLLFLHSNRGLVREFQGIVNLAVQSYWDAGLKLGHAVRTVADSVSLAKGDPQIATTLIEARGLWGSEALVQDLQRQFRRKVVDGRRKAFLLDCLQARYPDGADTGPPAQELEPDVKNSLGGLRDLHFIRWIGFALFDARDIDSLRMKGALTFDEARRLREAWEFLTRVRIDLHFAAGKAQDRLTRDEQLRITDSLGIQPTPTQRAVEVFMQQYFRHTSQVAQLSRRFATLHRPQSLVKQAREFLVGHRAERILRVGPQEIDVPPRHFSKICGDLERMLRLYRAAALYGVRPSPRVAEAIMAAVPRLDGTVSETSAKLFMEILRSTAPLGPILRSLYDTGLLDVLIPDITHVRHLMQFNQYHHYTVDEHTLRAVETCTRFENGTGPIAAAYANIRNKELLHLALILHDLGKGFGRPHAEVGREIAQRIAQRLCLPAAQGEIVIQLVARHLEMAHLAFRRDITDPETLVPFAHSVGTPDVLQMLYVLTAADVSAVGPSAWTEWKAELLTELFDHAMVILSGKHYGIHEQERLKTVARQVMSAAVPADAGDVEAQQQREAIERRLATFPSYYLTSTTPEAIAADLETIRTLGGEDISIRASYTPDTQTVEYRVVTANPSVTAGCFHKLAGALTARRLEILAADIATTSDGIVVDAFRVHDRDYQSEPPPERIAAVTSSLRDVLLGRTTVESLFLRNRRFGLDSTRKPVSDLPLRVLIDTESSENRTIIDVFAHDRPGLLFTISRTLFELGLSVDLAKIATHFDQVVDVFYVVENDGRKVLDPERVREVQRRLCCTLEEFEREGFRAFVA